MKIKLVIGALTIMATLSSISCATNSTASSEAKNSVPEKPAFEATAMQKKMAERAFKLGSENNPIIPYKFTADPAVLVYKDTVYVYGTNDQQQIEASLGEEDNTYNRINTLNVFSSKDLHNWTNCGEIKVAGSNGAAKWARNSWAPAIAMKNIDGKDKFFLYFADSANGIGVLSSDSPTGPFIDPIGTALVNRNHPNIKGVYWLFDPAVIVDDDGTGYIYFGGGLDKDAEHPKSGRCAKLSDDMIHLDSVPEEIDAPFLFEDSGINKIGNKYYYSYCSNWSSRDGAVGPVIPSIASICYMSSDSPLGPFEYKGEILLNPGKMFGPWGNNHHWMFKLQDKWYIAYHTQTTEKKVGITKGGYRNIFINELVINEDGSISEQKSSNINLNGPAQLKPFNPNEVIPAATARNSKDLVMTEEKVFPVKDYAFLEIENVDFSKAASKITVKVADGSKNGKLKVCVDNNAKGPVLAEIEIKGKGEYTADITFPEGEKNRNLYFVFFGNWAMSEWIVK